MSNALFLMYVVQVRFYWVLSIVCSFVFISVCLSVCLLLYKVYELHNNNNMMVSRI